MIKLSKDGVEIGHNRYLTDTSTGFALYFNILLMVKIGIFNIEFLNKQINAGFLSIDVMIILLSFFMATSVGMILSTISWILLEYVYIRVFEYMWFYSKIILSFIGYKSTFSSNLGNIPYSQWLIKIIDYEQYLIINKIDLTSVLVRRSLRILLRNIAFIFLIDASICFYKGYSFEGWLLVGSTVLALIFSGAIGFYSSFGIYLRYSSQEKKKTEPNSFEKYKKCSITFEE